MKNIKNYMLFALSYLLNAFGNALMVKGSVGALMWTSTFENVALFLGVSVGIASSILQVIFYVISKVIGKDFKLKDTVICITLSVFFGTLIDICLLIVGRTPLTNIYLNYIIAILGIFAIGFSVSLAIHANVAFLALDDFLKNLKIYVFKNNVVKATFSSLGIGFIIAIAFGLLHGEIANMTVLTIISSIAFGHIVQLADKILGYDKAN